MRGVRRVLEVTALVLLLSGVPGGLSVKGAETGLGGYVLGAVGTGVSWIYDQPSFGVPASPLFEMHETYAESKLDSGPSGYGLASFVWPGSVVANAPPAADPRAPGWPVRAESFYPQGPEERADTIGSAEQRSYTGETESGAVTRAFDSHLPGVIASHSRSSRTVTRVRDGIALADAVTTISDVSLFGDFIRIDSITSRARATSDGNEASADSSITVKGLTVNGHPYALEGSTLRLADQEHDPGATVLLQMARESLRAAGIQLYLAEPIDVSNGGMASTSIGGLIVTFESAAFAPYVPSMPDFVPPELSDPALDHSGVLILAPAAAEARAAPAFDFDSLFPTDGDDPAFVLGGTAGTPGSEEFIPGTQTTIERPERDIASPDAPMRRTRAGIPIPDIFAGVPLALLGLLLGGVLVASRLLARAADAALAGRGAGACPYKEDV